MDPLLFGLSMGLAGGLTPGPLLALILSATLERGPAAGVRVAIAPLLADLPLVSLCVLVVREVPAGFLPLLSVAGGAVLFFFAWDTWKAAARAGEPLEAAASGAGRGGIGRELWRGLVANCLSPHPWLFWITAGAPLLLATWRRQPWIAVGFVALFYLGLVGTKVAIAMLAGRGMRHLDRAWHRRALLACAVLLAFFGASLWYQVAMGWTVPA